MTDIIRVCTVYGDTRYVSKSDMDNPRKILLPLYRANGKRVDDGRFVTSPWCLHRDNIANNG